MSEGPIDPHTLGTGDVVEYKDVNIKIEMHRWEAFITITDKAGKVLVEYVASADGLYTEGSWLWFGTREEHDLIFEEKMKELEEMDKEDEKA
jgi:hypothetical protein